MYHLNNCYLSRTPRCLLNKSNRSNEKHLARGSIPRDSIRPIRILSSNIILLLLGQLKAQLHSRLRIYRAAVIPARLDIPGILSFEPSEGLLRVPVPRRWGSEEEIHVFECALVTLWVESPDDRNGDDIADGEDVERFLVYGAEHDRAEEGLIVSYYSTEVRKAYQPAIPDTPANHTPCVSSRADCQREDLRLVQPWRSKPSCAEYGRVEEDHRRRCGSK